MMASEELRDDETVVSTTDGRSVILHGPEELRHEMVMWWDRYKRLFADFQPCPFCQMPVLTHYERWVTTGALGGGIAHQDCVEEFEYEREENARELERRREDDEDWNGP